MKFYMTPGSCSTGIHVLLEEIGLVFEAHLVNLLAGDQFRDEYLALNPKGTIPTLVREDGSALTDFQSIAWWLARSHPRRKLLPETPEAEARVLEAMGYAVNTIHGQGFARIFTAEKFTPNPADAALFYVEFWAVRTGLPLPSHCLAHYRRLLQRPAVRQVLLEEGYRSALD
jgi:glutathione S-transferase